MAAFVHAHATHPDARTAFARAAAQADAERARGALPLEPTLGLLYITDHLAPQAEALLADARQRWPGAAWAGCTGVGVAASGVEYFDEPALALLLADLPAGRFEVFSGRRPLSRIAPWTALVHADPTTPELPELLIELADRTESGYLFGGLASARSRNVQFADGVFEGGLSGVAFSGEVALVSRVTQGCQPVGPRHRVTAAERNVVLGLDDEPALPVLLRDLQVERAAPQKALERLRATLVGLSDEAVDSRRPTRLRAFGDEVRVRHLIGIDPGRHAVAVADTVEPGMTLAFCQRDPEAARRDLVRICAEIREEVEAGEPVAASTAGGPERAAREIAGAVYVSCAGRGGPHFGAPSAELQIVRHALGEVPLVGFFAGGEIAHHRLYGYTGVLTVFTRGA